MTTEAAVRVFVGSMILVSLALYALVSPWGLLLTLFVALNLVQSAFTGFCPAERAFRALGVGKARVSA